jgi:hypothetical protein
MLRSLFLSVLFGQVPSHYAAANGTDDRMMPGIVARDPTHDCAFEAAGRVRRSNCYQGQRCSGQCELASSFHLGLPV